MKKSILTSAIIIMVTAAIGVILSINGYPPEKEGLSEPAMQIRRVVTYPLFWAGFSAALAPIFIWLKRRQLDDPADKASRIPLIGAQIPAIVGLLFQILIPLGLYDVISKAGSLTIFFYFLSAIFFVIGNYVATATFGSRIGFRSPATLSDEKVWIKTHRFLGRNMVLLVLITLPLPWLTSGQTAQWLLLGSVVCLKGVTWLFARRLAARQKLRGALPQ